MFNSQFPSERKDTLPPSTRMRIENWELNIDQIPFVSLQRLGSIGCHEY